VHLIVVAQHRAVDLNRTFQRRLDQDALVEVGRHIDVVAQRLAIRDTGDADTGAERGRLDEQRVGEAALDAIQRRLPRPDPLRAAHHLPGKHADPMRGEHRLGHRFVDGDGRGHHPAADIRQIHQLKQTL